MESNTAIVPGSLQAIAERDGADLATLFMGADVLVIFDYSYSMADLARGGRSKHAVACDELAKLQRDHPGKVALIQFSDEVAFMPGGVPDPPTGGTDLAAALEFAHIADGCGMRIVVISDGEPNDENDALKQARRYQTKIDTIYIGEETGRGRDFLRRLAAATGGQSSANNVEDLAQRVETLMLTAGT